jgi:hypothetical protein
VKQRARAAQVPTVVGSQVSTEGSAEITSGRVDFQQGLAVRLRRTKTWCTRVKPRHEEDFGLAHEPIRAKKEG